MFIAIAFLTPLFYAIANIIECHLSNRTFKRPTTMIFYISLMNCIFLPLILFFGFPTIPPKELWVFYIVLGLIDVLYLYPYYKALKVIDTSIVSSLFSLGQITIPVLSYLVLREELNLHQYIGFAIIVMSSIALSIKDVNSLKLSRAFYLMCIVSLIRASAVIIEKYILNVDDNWINLVVYQAAISGFIPLFFLFNKNIRDNIFKNFVPYVKRIKVFVLNEFVCFIGMACSIYALSGLSPVITTSITSMIPIFMLAISYWLLKSFSIPLKEKISRRVMVKKIYCFTLITLGVILVVN